MSRPPVAVVDLGTNSTRLLVAELRGDGSLSTLTRRSEVTRLGDGVDSSGRLSEAALGRVAECMAGYRRAADELGAGESVAVATSAVRDADNGEEFRSAWSATGSGSTSGPSAARRRPG